MSGAASHRVICALRTLLVLLCLVLNVGVSSAHVGSKDVFEQLDLGPYRLFVTIRPPTVIPGVATVEIRSSGSAVDSLTITPVPLTGEASRHPPTPDPTERSAADPQFFTGSLWLMAQGSWKVQIAVTGTAGAQSGAVPVPAIPLSVLPMSRPMGVMLAALGLLLAVGMAGIVAAATREARLVPGAAPSLARRRRALVAGGFTLLVVALAVFAGGKWWDVEARAYSADVYRPLQMHPSLRSDVLTLTIDASTGSTQRRSRSNTDLLPDHGHLMHLYAIREPEMDAVYHLHPSLVGPGELQMALPALPPGRYRLFGDIVHRNGFPETLTASLDVPVGLKGVSLDSEDAAATPTPLRAGGRGANDRLPDGYTMVWHRPAATLRAGEPMLFRFELLNTSGEPATDVQPYLGMAGHAAFVKTDWSSFAHTHPEGSAAMQAMMLANPEGAMAAGPAMEDTPGSPQKANPRPLSSTVMFPYGFPTPGRFRIFVQMKHGSTVETGTFDGDVR